MHRDIHAVLRETWGFAEFRPMQEEVVRSVMAGRDTLALLPTGGGKSLCFQVPALAMGGLCIVVSPLIALMRDQVERLRKCGVRAAAVTSGMTSTEIDNALESAVNNKLSFLYVSPERLGSELFKMRLPSMPLSLLAVDEAHCISQWGYDFRPAYLLIAAVRGIHPSVPVIALTASATPEVTEDIMLRLAFREPNALRGSFSRPELVFWTSRAEDKLGALLKVTRNCPGSGIVYLRNRRGTVQTAHYLMEQGVSAAAYHAGLPHEERDRVQAAWSTGEVRYVCATNAFGMGIDKADVRSVIHMEPPPDMESYYQEAGRAGRDGQRAHAFLLAKSEDEAVMRERMLGSFPTLAQVRRVYQAFADKHRIALGAGAFEAYTLDLRDLARRTELTPSTVNGALKALELDGGIALSEGARTPSRAMLRADSGTVYRMRVEDPVRGPVVETMLRMYGGLFEEPSIVDEEAIATHLSISVAKVRRILQDLDRDKFLFYHPRNDLPTVTLMIPRRDAATLVLDREALQLREERARRRLEAMAHYSFRLETCREQAVLAYFGEATSAPCGRCDNCRKRMDAKRMAMEPAGRWGHDEHGVKRSVHSE
ncbi:MAG: RecQ family ATP-dependent DNA helicase [Flavobacteriales bacterium]